MKIAYIYTALSTKGGADRIITFKANYLAERYNYEVYIITDSQNDRPLAFPLSKKVKHINLDVDFGIQYNYNIIYRFFIYVKLMRDYKKKLSNIILNIKPNIVISTGGRDLEFITSIRDSSKKIAEIHTIRDSFRNFNLLEKKSIPFKIIAQYYRKKIDNKIKMLSSLVLLSENDAKSWGKIRDSIVIPNSIPFNTSKLSKCSNKKVISVGRLSYEKGFDNLIKAWKIVNEKFPDWELNIYGEGILKSKLEDDIDKYGLTNSTKIHNPTNDIVDKYIESSIYVMSSTFEGFGLVLAEAMSCGLPCISFNCPYGPSQIIKDNEDGFLVENGNIEKLADRICFLIANDDLRMKMGKTGAKNIQRYSPEIIMPIWNELLENLVKL